MSRSCALASCEIDVMGRRLDGSRKVSNPCVVRGLDLNLALAHPLARLNWRIKRMEALSTPGVYRITILITGILLPVLLTNCSKQASETDKKTDEKSEDGFLDKYAKPDERKYLLAAKPFF